MKNKRIVKATKNPKLDDNLTESGFIIPLDINDFFVLDDISHRIYKKA